jgi:hypothetical protein
MTYDEGDEDIYGNYAEARCRLDAGISQCR